MVDRASGHPGRIGIAFAAALAALEGFAYSFAFTASRVCDPIDPEVLDGMRRTFCHAYTQTGAGWILTVTLPPLAVAAVGFIARQQAKPRLFGAVWVFLTLGAFVFVFLGATDRW